MAICNQHLKHKAELKHAARNVVQRVMFGLMATSISVLLLLSFVAAHKLSPSPTTVERNTHAVEVPRCNPDQVSCGSLPGDNSLHKTTTTSHTADSAGKTLSAAAVAPMAATAQTASKALSSTANMQPTPAAAAAVPQQQHGKTSRAAPDITSSSHNSSSSYYTAHALAIISKAASLLPQKQLADKGGYLEFLIFVSDAENVPTFNDKHFNPVVVPVMPPSLKQQHQLGPGVDIISLLAQHRAQFVLSVGNRGHFDFLQQLPAQVRQVWFHIDHPHMLTTDAVETYYFAAIRTPREGLRTEPLLSLFTPAYKSGKKIRIPYESLLQQTYQNWEWVVYDDSPLDHTDTWAELSALRDEDHRVLPIKSDRNDAFIGSVKAKACAASSGQLLIELDHDDRLMPDALELLAEAWVANPDAGLFYGETVRQYEGTNQTVDYGPVWGYGYGAHYRMLVDGVWMTGGTAPTLNEKTLRHIIGVPNHVRAWSRAAYFDIGGHLPGLPVADDYELILRTLFKYPAVYLRHMSYIQRLVDITARHYESDISTLLREHNMTDRGRKALEGRHKGVQDEWFPTGPPLERSYHKLTATAAAHAPHVTVVIPTYNNTQGLMAAVRSVYAQDYHKWELLIVGDQCPHLDAFMEQHKQMFAEGGKFVRYYNLPRHRGGGHHGPLNMAVRGLVASDWVAYLKDTGVWKHDHLGSLVAEIAKDPSRSYAFASLEFDTSSSSSSSSSHHSASNRGDERLLLLADFPRKFRMDTSAVLHHKRLIEKYGGWRAQADVGAANDWELFSRWSDEPWGASLRPTVVYSGLPAHSVRWLISQA